MPRQSSRPFIAILIIAVSTISTAGQARGIEPTAVRKQDSPSKEATAKASPATDSSKRQSAKRESTRRPMLVPPPPPTIPGSTMLTFMAPLPIEMLSESDLKKQRDQTALELKRARDTEHREDEWFRERKGRSELFVSLYKEGVVSRRELEVAQRDAAKSEIDLTDARLKVTDLERDMKKIETRLQELSKQTAGKGKPAGKTADKPAKKTARK